MRTDPSVIGHTAKIVDLGLYRARKLPAHAKPCLSSAPSLKIGAKRPLAGEALKRQQRETIEKLRALGYEMSRRSDR